MKKVNVLLLVTLFLSAFWVNAHAAATVGFELSVSQQDKGNAVFSVDVTEGSQLYTTEFYILFDSEKLSFVKDSEAPGSACDGLSPYITANEIEKGRVKVSYTCTTALTKDGTAVSLEFKVREDGMHEAQLEVEHAETFDGRDITELDFVSKGCVAELERTSASLQSVAAIAVPVAAALMIAIVIKIKKK